jgi:hypothetical protein
MDVAEESAPLKVDGWPRPETRLPWEPPEANVFGAWYLRISKWNMSTTKNGMDIIVGDT